MRSIAIIGGGPAGATAAERLLQSARAMGQAAPEVLVFEEKPGWEKPCGGGLTAKAVSRYPFLLEACHAHVQVEDAELVAANGESVRMRLRAPLLIYSRQVLNALLLQRAKDAGARVIEDRVVSFERGQDGWRLRGKSGEYRAERLILAAGIRSGLRRLLAPPVAPGDCLLTFGYFAPAKDRLLRVQFFEGFEGYAWAFPRPDHLSLGIAGKVGDNDMAGLQRRLREFIDRFGYTVGPERRIFGHLLPALGKSSWHGLSLAGDGWQMAGDVAGLADPLTGEGIYFAMRSGELAAETLLEGRPGAYAGRVWDEFGCRHESGARHAPRFYQGEFWGRPVTTRMVEFCSRSRAFMKLLQDLFDGAQPYPELSSRVYRILARGLVEIAANSAQTAAMRVLRLATGGRAA